MMIVYYQANQQIHRAHPFVYKCVEILVKVSYNTILAMQNRSMNYTKMSLKVKFNVISLYFRCEIPVIIMGETGCGKTRLIKFMCALQQPPGVTVENMILMKVSYIL